MKTCADSLPKVRTREVDMADYVKRFRDVERFEGFCQACHNYGTCWICPPFDDDTGSPFEKYESLLLIACTLPRPAESDHLMLLQEMMPARELLEQSLLQLEKTTGGRAFGFTGFCIYCKECSRKKGEKCRFPEKARPSLEAYGFDLCATMDQLFGVSLEWAGKGRTPEEVTLIGGLAHNKPQGTVRFKWCED